MTDQPTPDEARALLEQASRTSSTTRVGASWPHIAGLLGMGAASSLALPALAFAPDDMRALPLILMFAWIAALFVFAGVFGRSLKQGFGRRWTLTIVVWGVLWVVGIFGMYFWFVDQDWFLITISVLLSAVTLGGAWAEARR
ncbi:MAG: hypothetical protein QM713_14150 [Arachnia sp.]